jgi:hypothetical protein
MKIKNALAGRPGLAGHGNDHSQVIITYDIFD